MANQVQGHPDDGFKKNIALGLLDIAIFLALAGSTNFGLPQVQPIPPWSRVSAEDGLLMTSSLSDASVHLNERFRSLKSSAIDDSLRDYRVIMEDARRRLPVFHTVFASSNNSVREQSFHSNLTTLILSEGDTSPVHLSIASTLTDLRDDFIAEEQLNIFDSGNPLDRGPLVDLHGSNIAQEETYFDNLEDVRWQDFLTGEVLNNSVGYGFDPASATSVGLSGSTQASALCDVLDETAPVTSESAVGPDSFPTTSSSTDLHLSTENPCANQSSNSGNCSRANSSDADLMQQMYLQDIDLGFNWQASEPTKQLKDVDDIFVEKPVESISYVVDGETGEHIPVASPAAPPQQAQRTVTSQPIDPDSQPNFFNIDEYLDMFGTASEGMQSQMQENVEQGVLNVHNLTSLLDPGENGTAIAEPNESLWDDIANLSALTGLNFAAGPRIAAQVPESSARLPCTPLPNNPNSSALDQAGTYKNPIAFNETDPVFSDSDTVYETQPSNVYGSRPLSRYSAPSSEPVQSYPALSPCLNSSSVLSEMGDTVDSPNSHGSSPLQTNNLLPRNFPAHQFNNVHVAMDTCEPSLPVDSGQQTTPPGVTMEPGQLFFSHGQVQNFTTALGDLMAVDASVVPLQNIVNNSYLNPPSTSFHRPPLQNSSPVPILGFQDKQETPLQTLDSGAISESYESDSGVSMGHSPQSFECVTALVGDDGISLGAVADDQSEHFAEDDESANVGAMDTINHNHTYNGTVGKARTKKKLERLLAPRESRDVRKARELNIPFTMEEIIMSQVEEYNEMLVRTPLSQAQQALIKDIRRRGKNKVAAQNCRKRKIETITHMEEDVEALRTKKESLLDEQRSLETSKEEIQSKYNALYRQIFSSLRDESGRPYDAGRFSLEQVEGAVILMPRVAHGNRNQDSEQAMEHEVSEVDLVKVKMEKE